MTTWFQQYWMLVNTSDIEVLLRSRWQLVNILRSVRDFESRTRLKRRRMIVFMIYCLHEDCDKGLCPNT